MRKKSRDSKKSKLAPVIKRVCIFGIALVVFFVMDNSTSIISNFNDFGRWLEETLQPIEWMQLFKKQALNYATLIWGGLLLLDIVYTVIHTIYRKKQSPRSTP